MPVHEQYSLKFVNIAVEAWGGIIDKQPQGIDDDSAQQGFLYSPLSTFLYISAFYAGTESIDDIITILEDALNGNIGDPCLPVEMTTTTILNHESVSLLDGNKEMILPIIDLKAMLLEYKEFLNTPPLKGTLRG